MQEEPGVYISWSMWGVAYAVVTGVRIVGVVHGNLGRSGRLGWKLDNEGGKAEAALGMWRSAAAVVNGRALVDAHQQLVDDIRH